jgi:8-oxo-dGTP pyrophosphatase MutT (NUDIX family)
MTDQTKPKPAATVILLRRAEPNNFEVFLTRRPDAMPFLGGKYCFPGGTMRKSDYQAGMLRRCFGLTPNQAREIIGAQFRPQEALGLWVAGIRELFEEVGVLLAVDDSGHRFSMDQGRARELADKHRRLLDQSLTFLSLLESENLRCELSSLVFFSRWQTPARFSLRFDTRFFVATLPDDQVPLATSYEVAHSVWLTPDRALQLFAAGELPMIFPTFASIRTLADFETMESVFKEFGRPNATEL